MWKGINDETPQGNAFPRAPASTCKYPHTGINMLMIIEIYILKGSFFKKLRKHITGGYSSMIQCLINVGSSIQSPEMPPTHAFLCGI